MPHIRILSWSSKYDVRPDNITLADHSCKQYLEDLLGAVRHGLERQRTTSSSSSIASLPPLEASTPRRDRLGSIQDDIRHENRIMLLDLLGSINSIWI